MKEIFRIGKEKRKSKNKIKVVRIRMYAKVNVRSLD